MTTKLYRRYLEIEGDPLDRIDAIMSRRGSVNSDPWNGNEPRTAVIVEIEATANGDWPRRWRIDTVVNLRPERKKVDPKTVGDMQVPGLGYPEIDFNILELGIDIEQPLTV